MKAIGALRKGLGALVALVTGGNYGAPVRPVQVTGDSKPWENPFAKRRARLFKRSQHGRVFGPPRLTGARAEKVARSCARSNLLVLWKYVPTYQNMPEPVPDAMPVFIDEWKAKLAQRSTA